MSGPALITRARATAWVVRFALFFVFSFLLVQKAKEIHKAPVILSVELPMPLIIHSLRIERLKFQISGLNQDANSIVFGPSCHDLFPFGCSSLGQLLLPFLPASTRIDD